ncbi:MAG: aminodeoxychorismate synthase component I [Chitinophagaceae bacterium]
MKALQNIQEAKQKINFLAKERKPFFALVNFELSECHIVEEKALQNNVIRFQFPNFSNFEHCAKPVHTIQFEKKAIDIDEYNKSFQKVHQELMYGNSFLANLTASTPIVLNASLEEVFNAVAAKYKILFDDQWVCFSPETFIQIDEQGFLTSCPMKGTIDAALPDAEKMILNDKKEIAEHFTIVDLIRNDLSIVAHDVSVKRFRYIEKIKTEHKTLLQVSSEIRAKLPNDYQSMLGDILFSLLPAGSISGAPKKKTVEIILDAETHQRGFYTGVAFWYDGVSLDSCVLIRFIEKTNTGYVYKSGGGITTQSDMQKEFQELIDKVYVPLF